MQFKLTAFLVALFAFALTLSTPAMAACSLTDLSQCSSTELTALIGQLSGNATSTVPTGVLSGDALKNARNQAVLSPASKVILGNMKFVPQGEDQTGKVYTLTGVPSTGTLNQLVSSVALYDGTSQVTNFVAPSKNSNVVTFSGKNILTSLKFSKGGSKTLSIVANTLGGVDGRSIYFKGKISTIGDVSRRSFTSPTVDLRTNIGSEVETGKYTLYPTVLEVYKHPYSPTGTVGRGAYRTYASFGIDSYGTINTLEIKDICFYDKVGIPAGTTPAMYKLIDNDTAMTFPATVTVDAGKAKVCFSGINGLSIDPGFTRQIALRVTTIDSSVWPSNTAMQWSIASAADIKAFEAGKPVGVGYGGYYYSVPADANLVNIGW